MNQQNTQNKMLFTKVKSILQEKKKTQSEILGFDKQKQT